MVVVGWGRMGGWGGVPSSVSLVLMNQRREIGVRELGQWELAWVLPRICSLVSDLPGHTKSMGDGRWKETDCEL